MPVNIYKKIPVAFVSTYLPRECGIATFTNNLAGSISEMYGERLGEGDRVKVVAITDIPEGYQYGNEVSFEIRTHNQRDYRRAADFLNFSGAEVVCLQHEFGIYGGDDGRYILSLLRNLKKPVVTVLHTIVKKPSDNQKEIMHQLCYHSSEIIVLANKGKELLRDVYGVNKTALKMIHHGAPDVPFLDPSYYKDYFQLSGKDIILTFGLIGPNKGLEVAIKALATVVEDFPDAVYLILGETHPAIKRERGEEYRISLEHLVHRLNLEDNVIFHNRFVSMDELIKYMVAADIYVTPYLSREQISSGTLSYAVACGKAIVSTPYWHAEELLADGRGMLVPIGDEEELGGKFRALLGDKKKRNKMRKETYDFGRDMIWQEVAKSYINTFENIQKKFRSKKVTEGVSRRSEETLTFHELPEVKLSHLYRMTDSTGILEHANHSIPNKAHGYTTDDNARALIVTLKYWHQFRDSSVMELISTYLSFILHAYNSKNSKIRNRLSYDRNWLDEKGSEDSHSRVLWALGKMISEKVGEDCAKFSVQLYHQAVAEAGSFKSPRAWAFTILSLIDYLGQYPGDRNASKLIEDLGNRLFEAFKDNADDEWLWCEDVVSYENARLPQTLLSLSEFTENEEMKEIGLRSLKWLVEIQTDPEEGHLSIIGNNGWYKRSGERASFDQQPVEVAALIDACSTAYRVTGDKYFLEKMEWSFDWFLGSNDIGESLYNFKTGGCRDGIHPSRLNQNEGAESLISWLYSLLTMYEFVSE